MDVDVTLPDGCPLDIPAVTEFHRVLTDTGVIVLADPVDGSDEFVDLLDDGPLHAHHDGGFAVAGHTIAVGLPSDGTVVIGVHADDGQMAVSLDVDHIAETLRDHAGDEAFHVGESGWSEPHMIKVVSNRATVADPATLIDGEGSRVDLVWPEPGGYVMFASHRTDGVLDRVVFAWSAAI